MVSRLAGNESRVKALAGSNPVYSAQRSSSGEDATLSRSRGGIDTRTLYHMLRWSSWLRRHPLKVEITGSSPVRNTHTEVAQFGRAPGR